MEIPKLNHIQHIGIPVTNLKISEAFYQQLGFEKAMQAHFPYENKEEGTCVMMQNGFITIELYQFPEVGLGEIRQRKDGHIDHVAFDVSDIDATFLWAKEAGLNPIETEPVFLRFWKNGCKYFNITGPDGERLEFNQML